MGKGNKGFELAIQKTVGNLNRQIEKAGLTSRVQTLDKVLVALGEMGLKPEEISHFVDVYRDVEEDLVRYIREDGDVDKELVYYQHQIDTLLKQCVPEDKFAPYEERYNYGLLYLTNYINADALVIRLKRLKTDGNGLVNEKINETVDKAINLVNEGIKDQYKQNYEVWGKR